MEAHREDIDRSTQPIEQHIGIEIEARIVRKTDSGIDQERPEKRPKSSQKRPEIIENCSPGSPGRPGGVRRRFWHHPGSPRERPEPPREPPGEALGAPGRARGAEKGAHERPKAARGTQNRRRIASGSEEVALFRAFSSERRSESFFGRFFRRIPANRKGGDIGECAFRTTPASKTEGSAARLHGAQVDSSSFEKP
jgi:hypothetical protein